MLLFLKKLAPGLLSIAAVSAGLLFSDLDNRRVVLPRVAVFQASSNPQADDCRKGILEGLADAGYIEGRTAEVRTYPPSTDADVVAREIAAAKFDVIVVADVAARDALAKAGASGIIIFGPTAETTTAPTRTALQAPVVAALRTAQRLLRDLKRVGVVHDPAASDSRARLDETRADAKTLGLELLEAPLDAGAAAGLAGRGAQAIFVAGDAIVVEPIVADARKSGLPVFTAAPGKPDRGTMFDVGVDMVAVGRVSGDYAGRLLKDPSLKPALKVPTALALNCKALRGLKEPWSFTDELLAEAAVVCDDAGIRRKVELRKPQPGRTYRIGVIYYGPDVACDSCMAGFFEGLKERGFEEGKNLQVIKAHAAGEIAAMPQLFQNYDNLRLDLIVSMSTPCLSASLSTVRRTPVVFMFVTDPLATPAGKTFTDHNPNWAGVGAFPDLPGTLDVMQRLIPNVKKVGTLYNPAEANSVKVITVSRKLFAERNIELSEVGISASNEILQATQTLLGRNIQALWVSGDNTAFQGFETIAKLCAEANMPLITNDSEYVDKGAVAGVGLGWPENGRAASVMAARVLLGESPGNIPFENAAVIKVAFNETLAGKLGIRIPPDLLGKK